MFIIALIIICPAAAIIFGLGQIVLPRCPRVQHPVLFSLGIVIVIAITVMVTVGTGGAAACMTGCTLFAVLYLTCVD